MMDNAITSNNLVEHSLGGKKNNIIGEVELDIFLTSKFREWKEKVNSLRIDNYDALIITSYGAVRDSNNQQLSVKTVSEWTGANSTIPVFTLWTHGVGKGKAIGGLIISGYHQGAGAAAAVNVILATGEISPLEIPRHGELLFSVSELSRWNIKLPKYISTRSSFVE